MLKLASFLLKGKNSTIGGVVIAYFFVIEWVGIYEWLLSLLDSDTVSIPLGEEFPFSYHRMTVKGSWRSCDQVRFFFPNPWGAKHGDWVFSLLHEFLGLGPYTLAWTGSHCGPSFLVGSVPQLPS